MEQDIYILNRLLNSKLFLDKYPMIDRVHVNQYGKGVDVVMIVNDAKTYFPLREVIKDYIWDIGRYASVKSNLNIYP